MAQLKSTKVFGDLNVTGEVNVSTKITVNGKEVWDKSTLLNIGTTAATARTALGLGAGATRWPTFAEVTGKPSTYAPSGHTHPWSQVTGLSDAATTTVAAIQAGTTKADVGLSNVPNWAGTASVTDASDTKFATAGAVKKAYDRMPTWAQVTGKPTTFTPSTHTHTAAQITGLGSAATKNIGVSVVDFGTVSVGQRKVLPNPFGNSTAVSCSVRAEVKVGGVWHSTGFILSNVGRGGYGVAASAVSEGIVVQVGSVAVVTSGHFAGGTQDEEISTPLPCRVIVHYIGGAVT